MTGPAASVLLPRHCDRGELHAWLAGPFVRDGSEWRLRDPDALGLPYRPEETGPFAVQPGPWQPEDADVAVELPAIVGFQPGAEIVICAMVNGTDDHLVLGRLALALARRYDGLVHFAGPLPVPVDPRADPLPESAWQQWLAAARATAAGMPGTVYEVPYRTVGGTRWIHHLADAEFVAAWLQHPDFRMR